MNFQGTTLRRKKRLLYCRNPYCETNKFDSKLWHTRTLLPIHCLTYYLGQNTKERGENLIFYICRLCGQCNFEHFGNFPLYNEASDYNIRKIPEAFTNRFNHFIESMGEKCVFCELDMIVASDQEYLDESKKTSKPVYKIKPSAYKLFIKGGVPRRRHIGFLCVHCKAIYFSRIFDDINWPKFDRIKVNRFGPRIEVSQKKQKMEKEYGILKNQSITPNNEIRKQEVNTWHELIIKPTKKDDIEIEDSGLHHVRGIYDDQMSKSKKITITLENLTIRQAKNLIIEYGSEQQKRALEHHVFI